MKSRARALDPVRLRVFHELFCQIADEMGEVLRRAAPSVNIRERRDYSCAVFDPGGRLVSQAAHIPVHLGSAALSVAAARARFPDLREGDAVLLNDPFAGGTHLPDLTLVVPHAVEASAPWFLVTRAHHADVGGQSPGSMSPAADLCAEGLRIPPVLLRARGQVVADVLALLRANTRTPDEREGDLRAQLAACRAGGARLAALLGRHPAALVRQAVEGLHAYGRRMLRATLAELVPGRYRVVEALEAEDGGEIGLALVLDLRPSGALVFDFGACADQAPGSLNANPAVTRAAVLYALTCLVPDEVPVNEGLTEGVEIRTRPGSLLDPHPPAAVAGGNVETSQRLVDLCLAALGEAGARVPAQSSGTMNNVSLGGSLAGGRPFAFYETLGGGAGASSEGPGASAVQTHMTNTRNTPVEECELVLPLRVECCAIRRGSGGTGRHPGGDGLRKRWRALLPLSGSLLAERRELAPQGLAGGGPGSVGSQRIWRRGRWQAIPAKGRFELAAGDLLEVETPGGGGWG